jgi:RNA polymerase sigma-70 factor (ECF subfamily)
MEPEAKRSTVEHGADAYQRYGRALVRKAERILRSREDAQDMVQGLFVDMLEHPSPTLDLPYLYRATTHRCLSYVRDEKNRARLLERETVTLSGAPRTRCDDRALDMDLLVKLTRTLDDQTLEILFYRYFDDMTQEEIAEQLSLSRKTIGKKLDDITAAVRALTQEGPSS